MGLYSRIVVTRDSDGILLPKPRELTKKKANCAGFTVYTSHERGVPRAMVYRKMTARMIKKDPWNDDGRPPTLLFIIYYNIISILDASVELTGFEGGNICLAGEMVEPYKVTKRPLAEKIDSNERRHVDIRDSKQLFPQNVILLV